MEGALIEYSGAALGLYKATQSMLFFVITVFFATVFLGGLRFEGIHSLWAVLKLAGIAVVFILIKNTNPRVRIDSIVRFFWGPVTLIAAAAMILAYLGY